MNTVAAKCMAEACLAVAHDAPDTLIGDVSCSCADIPKLLSLFSLILIHNSALFFTPFDCLQT